MSKTRQQLKDDLRLELAEYVKLRQRIGPQITFARALSGHREVCVSNAFNAPDNYWFERVSLLDEIAREEGLAP